MTNEIDTFKAALSNMRLGIDYATMWGMDKSQCELTDRKYADRLIVASRLYKKLRKAVQRGATVDELERIIVTNCIVSVVSNKPYSVIGAEAMSKRLLSTSTSNLLQFMQRIMTGAIPQDKQFRQAALWAMRTLNTRGTFDSIICEYRNTIQGMRERYITRHEHQLRRIENCML